MAEKDWCVSARHVSKKFSRSLKRSFSYGALDLSRTLLGLRQADALRESEFWAVRDVSFELGRGRSLGIVGLNGSGKTTLLRMVSGILEPTLGDMRVSGRIAPMLALGAGFKPVLSGRENVFLNLSLLGVSERDIRARFDSIVDFAGIEDALDAPLGTYSSGMRSRLGFACAVHTDPSILIVDEVLSVGDAQFRIKCRNRINAMRREGTSMLLVSHSALLVETLTDECIFMRRGRAVMQGDPRQVLKAYENDIVKHADNKNARQLETRVLAETHKDTPFALQELLFRAAGAEPGYWVCGHDATLEIGFVAARALEEISINLMLFDLALEQSECVLFLGSSHDLGWLSVAPGQGRFRLQLPKLGLKPGTYRLKIAASMGGMHDILDVVDSIRVVVREGANVANSLFFQSREWHISGAQVTGHPPQTALLGDLESEHEF